MEFLIIGIILGLAVGYFAAHFLIKKGQSNVPDEAVQKQLLELSEKKSAAESMVSSLQTQKEELDLSFKDAKKQLQEQATDIATLKANEVHLKNQKDELENMRAQFNKEFETIAAKRVKQNSSGLSQFNQQRLQEVLNPFKEKLGSFERKVESLYEKEYRDKADLKAEVKKLFELNQRISEEANNLTKALKGDSKTQGDWGEVILERVLEQSGLQKGTEYKTQFTTQNKDGVTIKPDVIILLPDEKHVIIDAKVSLVAYEKYRSSEDEIDRSSALKAHVVSVRNHIKQLSEKNYDTSVGVHSPDFVLMFMPIEPAFSASIQADHDLFQYAWDRRIVIVSPSTLLATLKTISSIWKQERQNRNVMEIARLGGRIYDKLSETFEELDKIDQEIDKVHGKYKNAVKRLYTGRGNVVSTAEKIRKLGAKTTKNIPDEFLEEDNE